jgi:predicted amidophosphoribosyltransferase
MDDLYQSGTTMQFVAMKLKQAGARHVYGLALVKALSND